MLREALFSHREGNCCRMAGKSISWSEVHGCAAGLAAFLREQPGDSVLLFGYKGFDYVISIVACLFAGKTYIAATPALPEERILSMAEQSKTEHIVNMVPGHRWGNAALTVKTVEFAQAAKAYQPMESLPQVSPEAIAYLLFTSGSTGTPKGVRVTYANLESFLRWFTTLPALAELSPAVVLNQAQFSFDLSVADLYYTFWKGSSLALLPEYEILQGNDPFPALEESHAELGVFTPSFADICLMDDRFHAGNLPDLKTIFFCGETLRVGTVQRLWKRFPGLRVLNAYGPTEATCAVSAVEITPELACGESLPIGHAQGEAVTIRIVDEAGTKAAPGESGIIVLSGKSVAAGYLDGGTGFGTLDGERSFLTGDRGCFSQGYLWYEGRIDDQLKYKGYRIEPGEIESALCTLPMVRQAAVLPILLADGRVMALSAHIAVDDECTEERIKVELRRKLPDYMIPRTILFYDQLPLTPNGKIDRKRVKKC